SFSFLRPFDFMPVVDERTQDEPDVAIDIFFVRNADVVARLFKNCREIPRMDAGYILKQPSCSLYPSRCPGKPSKARPKPPNHCIFIYKTPAALQVRDNHAHAASR